MKNFLFVLVLLCGTVVCVADELTATQARHRTEIVSFLREEGFMPEVDGDGDVKFKREGSVYYIRVNSKDESPFFITLFSAFKYPSDYSREVIMIAANELNFYKGVKLLCYKQEIRVNAEMYYYDVEEFKYVFYKLIKQIKNVENDFLDECAKVTSVSVDAGNTTTTALSTTELGTLLVDEDFSSTSYAWQKSQSDGRVSFRNGKMIMEDLEGSGFFYVSYNLPKNLKNVDFQIEFPMKIKFSQDYSSMFFTLGESSTQCYTLGLSQWGSNITASYGTYETATKYFNYSERQDLNSSQNHVYVMIKKGKRVEWYADGNLLCSTRLDENMDMTEIGFLIPNKHKIEVDYLKIGSL
ncbi:MAG: hypothetical protein IJX44_04610 [Bacteroidaceae bacterium]|nr:hypothetical protein [Bacteroidaceae bacterium]